QHGGLRRRLAETVEQTRQIRGGEAVELHDAAAVRGAYDSVAVAERQPRNTLWRAELDPIAAQGGNERVQHVGGRDLALAMDGDVDVRVAPEVRLDVSLVLRHVRAAVDRDAARVGRLDPLGHRQVPDARP